MLIKIPKTNWYLPKDSIRGLEFEGCTLTIHTNIPHQYRFAPGGPAVYDRSLTVSDRHGEIFEFLSVNVFGGVCSASNLEN